MVCFHLLFHYCSVTFFDLMFYSISMEVTVFLYIVFLSRMLCISFSSTLFLMNFLCLLSVFALGHTVNHFELRFVYESSDLNEVIILSVCLMMIVES